MTFHAEVGRCNLILGPMFSGKTTYLCKELTTMADIGLKVLYINHSDDIRTSESKCQNMTTHHSSSKNISDKITTVSTDQLNTVCIDAFDVIGIDEGQFFKDLTEMVRQWVIDRNKIVYIASLDGDFRMQPFGQVHKLICIAYDIIKLRAKCMHCIKQTSPYQRICMVEAPFTGKIGGSSEQKEVGGKDIYEALCMKCYKDQIKT